MIGSSCHRTSHIVATREHSRLGMDAMQSGNLAEAEVRLRHALKSCPNDAEAHHHLAEVLRRQGRAADAIPHLQNAVKLSGGDPEWTVALGELLLESGDFNTAGIHAQAALERRPQLGRAWALQGDVLRSHRDYDNCLSSYHRALDCEEPYLPALAKAAEVYHQQGKYQRELASLRRYMAEESSDLLPQDLELRQALALQAMQRHEEAIPLFAEAEAKMGDHPEILLRSAESHLASGHLVVAEQKIATATQLQPSHPQLAALTSMVEKLKTQAPASDLGLR
jgi:tetratricopeptide (TPR) repeat protein